MLRFRLHLPNDASRPNEQQKHDPVLIISAGRNRGGNSNINLNFKDLEINPVSLELVVNDYLKRFVKK